MPACEIRYGDCRTILASLPENSFELAITSPPYNCGMDYGEEFGDDLSPALYWDFTSRWLAAVHRVLKQNGRLAVNLPWWMGSKPRLEVPFTFVSLAEKAGLTFFDKILWLKANPGGQVHVTGGYSYGCGWGTYLSPSGPSIRCGSEPILLFCKGSRSRGLIDGRGHGRCTPGDITPEQWAAWTIDVWNIQGSRDREHVATFPQEIPKRLALLYTMPGEAILDPFAGSGTTGLACLETGRSFLGCDISRKSCDLAEQRIAKAMEAVE